MKLYRIVVRSRETDEITEGGDFWPEKLLPVLKRSVEKRNSGDLRINDPSVLKEKASIQAIETDDLILETMEGGE